MEKLIKKIHDEVYQIKATSSDEWRAKLKKVLLKYTSTCRIETYGAVTKIRVTEGTIAVFHTIKNKVWIATHIEGVEN